MSWKFNMILLVYLNNDTEISKFVTQDFYFLHVGKLLYDIYGIDRFRIKFLGLNFNLKNWSEITMQLWIQIELHVLNCGKNVSFVEQDNFILQLWKENLWTIRMKMVKYKISGQLIYQSFVQNRFLNIQYTRQHYLVGGAENIA